MFCARQEHSPIEDLNFGVDIKTGVRNFRPYQVMNSTGFMHGCPPEKCQSENCGDEIPIMFSLSGETKYLPDLAALWSRLSLEYLLHDEHFFFVIQVIHLYTSVTKQAPTLGAWVRWGGEWSAWVLGFGLVGEGIGWMGMGWLVGLMGWVVHWWVERVCG